MRPDFNRYPLLVAWEMTHACDLACKHCRASAEPDPVPGELSTQEALLLLRELATFNPKPILLPTGGDPLKRPDLWLLLEESARLGLKIGITPAVTPLLTREAIGRFKDLGVHQMAISIDGASAAVHDTFRGVPGTFQRALDALDTAREMGLPTQINTTVTSVTRAELPAMLALAESHGVQSWEVFFLVPVGRGSMLEQLSADAFEEVLDWLAESARGSRLQIRTTEAPHYRRIKLQRQGQAPGQIPGSHVHDGYGFVFVSATGEVFPSGFLAKSAGNIRDNGLLPVYQNSRLFQDLRNPNMLGGKCGVCEYRFICGGSRARAWAETGDPLAEEPRCAYQPTAVSVAP